MKKRLMSFMCAAALCVSLMPAAYASQIDEEALPVLATMGVMNGDASGNLNLEAPVTRAAFVKMAVAASVYQDAATGQAHVSPFADVKYTHWAAGYVKTGVDVGWINGYLDGTFRPDNRVRLEEAVNICLKMLGYTDADFASGTFPYPQMAMYENKKLSRGIDAKRGEELTRGECAQLIYNTLNAVTKTGALYAQTMGYGVDASGRIDALSVVNRELEGPVVMGSTSLADEVGFTPVTVYRNDKESTASAIMPYDVVYYLDKTKTVWAYHNQVTGVYEAASPSRSNPAAVVVSGMNYGFETSAAAQAMSTTGTFAIGDSVTLLLGRNNTVVAVLDPAKADASNHGIVLSTGTATYMDAQGKPYTAPCIKMLGVDGTVYQYQTMRSYDFESGDLVKVVFENGKAEVSRLSQSGAKISGKVSGDAKKLGNYAFADDAKVMDYVDESAMNVPVERLANVRLSTDDIAYCELNGAEEIETLILKDVTGDLYQFGILADAFEVPTMNPRVTDHYYTLLAGGQEVGPLMTKGVSYPVKENQVIRFRMNGTSLEKLYALQEVKLTSAAGGTAIAKDGETYDISRGVQVYLKQNVAGEGTKYFLTALEKVSGNQYQLTGWYDKEESNGGRMRVIVAED